jgi:hypothetical protein
LKKIAVIVGVIALCSGESALSATTSCEQQAAQKKLSLAAETRFIKECQKEAVAVATMACDSQAEAKQLSGTAKKSFTKKCVKDATRTERPVKGFPGIG